MPAAVTVSTHNVMRPVRPRGPGAARMNTGVAVPAIKRKIITWSSRWSRCRHSCDQVPQ